MADEDFYKHIVRLAYEKPTLRSHLLPLIHKTGGNLSTLDVRIYDFVRNRFLDEVTDAFIDNFDYKTTITKRNPGYIEGRRNQLVWRLKFEIVHRGDSYQIDTTLHAGTSFQNSQFTKYETGQQDSLDDLFSKINKTLAGFMG